MLKLAAVLAWCITMIATADSAPSSNGWPYNARNYNIYYGRGSWPQPITREAWWPTKIHGFRPHGQNGVPYSWALLRTGESMRPSKTYETTSHDQNGASNSWPQPSARENWSPSKTYETTPHEQNGVPYSWGLLRTGESMWPSKTYKTGSHDQNGASNSWPQPPARENWSPKTPLPLSDDFDYMNDILKNDECPKGKSKIGKNCYELESELEEVDHQRGSRSEEVDYDQQYTFYG